MTGEARFLSHHDVMRLMARAAARADLPLSYSRGFNPRPRLSLPLPRPVGVASSCELMTVELDGAADAAGLTRQLGRQLPAGMTVGGADPLGPGAPPRVASASYHLPLPPGQRPRVAERIRSLNDMRRWEVARRARPSSRPGPGAERVIDIRGRVGRLDCGADGLSFTLLNTPDGSAKCREVLELLGLGESLAELRRTGLEYEFAPKPRTGRNGKA